MKNVIDRDLTLKKVHLCTQSLSLLSAPPYLRSWSRIDFCGRFSKNPLNLTSNHIPSQLLSVITDYSFRPFKTLTPHHKTTTTMAQYHKLGPIYLNFRNFSLFSQLVQTPTFTDIPSQKYTWLRISTHSKNLIPPTHISPICSITLNTL